MKKLLLIASSLIFLMKLNGQTAHNETESITNLPIGISYQTGPGDNNNLNWIYPYATKLTVFGDLSRNFELSTMLKDNEGFMIRQFRHNTNNWTSWKKFILDDGNGNVGIGTSSPSAKLTNSGSHITTKGLLNLNSTTGTIAAITFYQGGSYSGTIWAGTDNDMYIGTAGSDNLKFYTNAGNNVRMIIDPSGNVGIGTTSITSPLTIRKPTAHLIPTLEVVHVSETPGCNGCINIGQKITVSNSQGTNERNVGLWVSAKGAINNYAAVFENGNVGIGTTSPAYKLDVCGTIRASEVKVDLLGTCVPDFVFEDDYRPMDLNDLEKFIKTNQHLPEIASENEMVENGVNMKDMQMKLLQKIEELTPYTIEQQKQINELRKEIKEMKK